MKQNYIDERKEQFKEWYGSTIDEVFNKLLLEKRKYVAHLYGFGGVSCSYKPLSHFAIEYEHLSINELKNRAWTMCSENPEIREVYVVETYPSLKRDFDDTWKGGQRFEKYLEFYDLIVRKGIKII